MIYLTYSKRAKKKVLLHAHIVVYNVTALRSEHIQNNKPPLPGTGTCDDPVDSSSYVNNSGEVLHATLASYMHKERRRGRWRSKKMTHAAFQEPFYHSTTYTNRSSSDVEGSEGSSSPVIYFWHKQLSKIKEWFLLKVMALYCNSLYIEFNRFSSSLC